ncbi:MAG: MarP family serine protease [Acidimicrobiales bacterium]|nr:MarP family serine protease [Acidimicrobiales bacterium]
MMRLLNLLDALIVLAAVGAALGGYRLGFVTRATAWGGMVIGVLLAARVAPLLTDRFGGIDPNRSLLISAITLLTGAFFGQLGGQALGSRFHDRSRTGKGAQLDRVAGAASGVALVLAGVWLLTPAMAGVPSWPQRLVDGSLLAHQIDVLTPDPPDPITAASKIVGARQWEELTEQLNGGLPEGPIPDLGEPSPELDAVVRPAIVLVEHDGCSGSQVGTGFVAEPHLVVTNAHVVASGSDDTAYSVTDDAGKQHRARVVHFDPEDDLAVLYVRDLDAPALTLAEGIDPGTIGWVYGHPLGGELERREFKAAAATDALVPDIYGEREVTRKIVPIRAALEKGHSGSPLVDLDGHVVGVAFAISPDDESLAVAIAMSSVRDAVDTVTTARAEGDPAEVSTGNRCLELG